MTSSYPDYVVYILGIIVILEMLGFFLAVCEITRLNHRIKLSKIDKKFLEERLLVREWHSNTLRISILLREENYSHQAIQRQGFQDLLIETLELYQKLKILNPEMSNDIDADLMENFYTSLIAVKNYLPS